MSYTEICDNFELVALHLKKGGQVVNALHTFFKGLKKNLESFNGNLQKLSESLFAEFPKDGNTDTAAGALGSMAAYIKFHTNAQNLFAKNIQLDIVEPLELFINHFNTTHASLSSQGSVFMKDLTKSKEKTKKLRRNYLETAKQAEKSEKLIAEEDTKDKQEKALRQALYNRMLVNKASENYSKSHQEMTAAWDTYDSEMPEILEFMQQNEESRIHFLKYTFEKYAKHSKTYCQGIDESLDEVLLVLNKINSSLDVKMLVDKLKTHKVKRKEMTSYDK